MRLRVLLGALVVLLFTVPVWAQLGRATITGTVTDPSGAAISGVSVTVTDQDTGVQTSGVSNEVGIYRVPDLPVGRYTLLLSKTGFETVERAGITLSISQIAEINITMTVGQVSQRVEVTAAAPILQTETTETGGEMSSEAYENLPMDVSGGRDVQMFAFETVPSVEGDPWSTWSAGELADSSEVLIDGTLSSEYAPGLISESNPPFVAVEEFKVDTGGMGGQAGMYTGGTTFEYQLKSGTNQLHGSAEGFLQNEVLDANSWTNDFQGIPKARNRRDDIAFGVGGPVLIPKVYNGKNKTFFFFAWEREKEADFTPGGLTETVPTADFMNGNFGALLGTPLCNASGVEGPCSSTAGTPMYVQDTEGNTVPLVEGMIFDPASPGEVFPGNQIPTSRFSSYSNKLLAIYQKYYAPLVPSIKNNYTLTATNAPNFEEKNWSVKLDHNFSGTDRMAGSFIYNNRPRELADSNPGPFSAVDPTDDGGPFSNAREQLVTTRAWRLNETHIFSRNVVNVAALTYQRFAFGDHVFTNEVDQWPSGLFAGSSHPAILVSFGNSVNGVGETSIGTGNSGNLTSSPSFVVDENLTWQKGRHTLAFGGEYRALQLNSGGTPGTMDYSFANDQTGTPTDSQIAPYLGFGFASFLLGDVASAQMTIPAGLEGRRKEFSLYAQDSFKVNNRLTVNYGLTWNLTLPLHEKYGRWANFNTSYSDPATGMAGEVDYLSPSPTQLTGGSKSFENINYRWFAPHLGIAYKITNRVVARAAYSLFDIPFGGYGEGVPYGYAPGYFPTNQVTEPANFAPAFDWDNGYPGQSISGTLSPEITQWTNTTMSPKALEPSINKQANVGVEYELTQNTRLTVNYLGTWGIHLKDGSLQQNLAPDSAYVPMLNNGTAYNWVSDSASAAAADVPYPYQGFEGYAYEALSPFANIASAFGGSGAGLFYVGSPLGWSHYDAFQAEVNHRTSHGLTMDMSNTFSRNLSSFPSNYTLGGSGLYLGSNFQETWASWTWFQNIFDLSAKANFEKPYNENITKGYILYGLPFGRDRKFVSNANRWVNQAVSDWTLGTVLGYYTGTPMPVYSSNYYPGLSNSTAVYVNVAPGADLGRHFHTSRFDQNNPADPANMYFKPGSFSNPAYGQFGNGGPYIAGLNAFGTASEDASLYKDFGLREKMKLQVKIDYFDVFNRHYFNNPDTNIADPLFGQVTSVQGTHRVGQFSMRFEW